jgi:3-carboxy-cis,cis-muconate cycloisomerase
MSGGLYTPFLHDARIDALMGPDGLLRHMLTFEVALARVEARLGVIPQAAADDIALSARPGSFDLAGLAAATALAGNPAIPFVKALTALVPPDAARFVHWGATSQDVMDTALVLQLKEVLAQFSAQLTELGQALAVKAGEHRSTPMAARTLLQQALPTSFGAKVAGWLMPVMRHLERIDELKPRLLVAQLGGAAGTRAALGGAGEIVARGLADELQLGHAPLPWHSARDNLAEFAALCGMICGTLGKIAQDVALLMQTEIGEVLEGAAPGKGGSSTLPHKRNPVAAHAMLAIATLAPGLVSTVMAAQVQAHERAVGTWSTEWIALPQLASHAGAALTHAIALITALEIVPARMRSNLDATHGLIMAEAVMMALAQHVGRGAAHHQVELATRQALREQRHLRDVLGDDPAVTTYLPAAELAALFQPEAYMGEASAFADQAVSLWAARPFVPSG